MSKIPVYFNHDTKKLIGYIKFSDTNYKELIINNTLNNIPLGLNGAILKKYDGTMKLVHVSINK